MIVLHAHAVVVEDPWFGPWVKVTSPWGGANWTVGPLHVIKLFLEELSNPGQRARTEEFNEKPCNHDYVDGLVTGSITYPSTQWVLGVRDASFENITGGPMWFTKWHSDVTYSESGPPKNRKATLHFVCQNYQRYGPSNPWVLIKEFWLDVIFDIVEDKYSGLTKYLNWRIGSYSSNQLTPPTVASCACPASGSATTGLFGILPSFLDLIQEMKGEFGSVPANNRARDEAIFNAVDDMDIEGLNLIEGVGDLAALQDMLKPVLDIFKLKPNIRSVLKLLASLHLWWRYVIKTGIMDIKAVHAFFRWLRDHRKELANALRKILMIGRGDSGPDKWPALYGEIDDRRNAKVCYGSDTSSFRGWMHTLHILGITPSWYDLWDLIPLSFVIDWVIPVGEGIDNTEDMMVMQQLPLQYLVLTRKLTYEASRTFTHASHSYTVDVKIVQYRRKVSFRLPKDMWMGLRFSDPRKQTLTGIALVVSLLTGGPETKRHGNDLALP